MTLGCGAATKSWLHKCVRSAAKRTVMAAFILHCFFGGGSRSTKTLFFPYEVVSAHDERYLVCTAGAVCSLWCVIGSLMVFCNAWFVVCA